jgi:hypothetical protein
MKRKFVLILIVILAVLASGVLTFSLVFQRGTETSSTTNAFQSTTSIISSTTESRSIQTFLGTTNSVVNVSLGIALQLSLNSTTVKSLMIRIEEYNLQDHLNNIPAKNMWADQNLGQGFGPCDFENSPMRLSVFAGHYLQRNLSVATPLQVVNPTLPPLCSEGLTINSFAFQPTSDYTSVSFCSGNPCVNGHVDENLQISLEVNGTWSTSGAYEPLNSGTYTIAADDEWGNLVFCYILVPPYDYQF